MLNKFRGNRGNNERKFKKRREQLVENLQNKGIKDKNVLDAFRKVPRHLMIDTALEDRAYEDTALPIGKQQTISQPFTVARQTELMQVQKGDKVLEIGTGSGYQAAILLEMGAYVYTVERHKELYEYARNMLESLGYTRNIRFKLGDGSKGWSAYAPYDAMVVTAGAPTVPEPLLNQLAPEGRLVIPIGDEKKQKMVRVTRRAEEEEEGEEPSYIQEEFAHFRFVPLIGEAGWED